MAKETNVAEQPELDEKELSPEEYAEAKAKAMEHLVGEIEVLTVEKQYHELLAQIEEQKLKRLMMIRQMASVMAPPQGEMGDQEPSSKDAEKPVRTLKKKS
jgi:hypothetical protein